MPRIVTINIDGTPYDIAAGTLVTSIHRILGAPVRKAPIFQLEFEDLYAGSGASPHQITDMQYAYVLYAVDGVESLLRFNGGYTGNYGAVLPNALLQVLEDMQVSTATNLYFLDTDSGFGVLRVSGNWYFLVNEIGSMGNQTFRTDFYPFTGVGYEVRQGSSPACVVTFMKNDGTLSRVATQSVAKGSTVSAPAQPTLSGWDFSGWYMDPFGQEAFDFNRPVVSDKILYAKWVSQSTVSGTVTVGSSGTSSVSSIGFTVSGEIHSSSLGSISPSTLGGANIRSMVTRKGSTGFRYGIMFYTEDCSCLQGTLQLGPYTLEIANSGSQRLTDEQAEYLIANEGNTIPWTWRPSLVFAG